MNVNYFALENHLKQKLTTLNGDLQFFRDILNDCKKSDDKELNNLANKIRKTKLK